MLLLQVEVVEWIVDNPETGWILVLAYLIWEIRGRKGRIQGVVEMVRSNTVVVRAIARTNEDIDTEAADEYLSTDEIEPGDFINVRSRSRYRDEDGNVHETEPNDPHAKDNGDEQEDE